MPNRYFRRLASWWLSKNQLMVPLQARNRFEKTIMDKTRKFWSSWWSQLGLLKCLRESKNISFQRLQRTFRSRSEKTLWQSITSNSKWRMPSWTESGTTFTESKKSRRSWSTTRSKSSSITTRSTSQSRILTTKRLSYSWMPPASSWRSIISKYLKIIFQLPSSKGWR